VLAALVVSLRGDLAVALDEVARARDRIAELEERLAKTSRNSGKPPSSGGLARPPPAPRSPRKKAGRRPGGRDGHAGRTLAQVAEPDREVVHEPAGCAGCGAGLAGAPVTGAGRRQVFDLPPAAVQVTEHQLIEQPNDSASARKPTGTPRRTVSLCVPATGPRPGTSARH